MASIVALLATCITGPAAATGGGTPPPPADCTSENYALDRFEQVSYGNNDGTMPWLGPWQEQDTSTGTGNGPSIGPIKIKNGKLCLSDYPDTYKQGNVQRGVDLSSCDTATLTFDYCSSGTLESTDKVSVWVWSEAKGWSQLVQFVDDACGSKSFDISQWISSNTVIKFRVDENLGAMDEYFCFDNVKVCCGGGGDDCEAVQLVKWDFDACRAGTGKCYTNAPRILSNGDCVSVTATEPCTDLGAFSCQPGVSGYAACYPALNNTSFVANSQKAVRTSVTLQPGANQFGQLTELCFYAKGAKGTGYSAPQRFGVRVVIGNTEVFRQVDLPLTGSFVRHCFDFSGDPDFKVDGTTTFKFEILGYKGDGVIEIDNMIASGGCCDKLLGALGDFVWFDTDMDGIQDAGEAGIPGVTVRLEDAGGNTLATDITDANGVYGFSDLPAGNYCVVFVKPAQHVSSPQNQGANDAVDSDADPVTGKACVTLGAGETNLTIDAGFYLPLGALGDRVWFDTDMDGIQDAGEAGISGVTVRLEDGGGNTLASTTTGANGIYGFSNLPAGNYCVVFVKPAQHVSSPQNQGANDAVDSDADPVTGKACVTLGVGETNLTIDAGFYLPLGALGDFVWFDTDMDGIQDAGEAGVPGVTVNLRGPGNVLLATDVTDANGIYGFSNLSAGNYCVEFIKPAQHVSSPQNQGANDAVDSDADPVTGLACVTLGIGETNLTIDAGIYLPLGKIGDFVWYDADQDGIQDVGEFGIPGVTVRLEDGGGNTIASTVTDGSGIYCFDNLPAGNYCVVFVKPNELAASPQNQGANDALDSDADPVTGKVCLTLAVGETNLTIDAGFFEQCTPYYMYAVADEPGAQLTRIRVTDPLGTLTVVADAIQYAGAAPGGVLVSDFGIGDVIEDTESAACDPALGRTWVTTNNYDGDTILLLLDLETGFATSINYTRRANGARVDNINSLAYNTVTDMLYGVTTDGDHLLVIDPTTAICTVFANSIAAGTNADFEGLAFDYSVSPPVLYAVDERIGKVFTIDISTGLGTLVGTTMPTFESIEFGADGTLYAVSHLSRLFTIDRVTYVATVVDDALHFDGEGLVLKCDPENDLVVGSFAAASNPDGIRVGWSVPVETPDLQAMLYRRAGGEAYELVYQSQSVAKAGGHSARAAGGAEFQWVDANVALGNTYTYRVVLTDRHGRIVMGNPASTSPSEATDVPGLPSRYELVQNHPNPFNPMTQIRFSLPVDGAVKLTVHDAAGKLVRTLISRDMTAGQHAVLWQGTNDQGGAVPTGVYFYRLVTPDFTDTKKMVLAK